MTPADFGTQVYQCAWSADSRLLVTGSKDCTLKVWNARTGNLAMDLPGHEDEVCKMHISATATAANMHLLGLRRGLGGRREDGGIRWERQGSEDVEELVSTRVKTGTDDTLPCRTILSEAPESEKMRWK